MTTQAWLEELALAGWRFWTEEGKLRYRAPRSTAVAPTLEKLRDWKAEVMDLLARAPESLSLAPLSYGQRALWFLWRLAPESLAYNQSLPLRLPPRASSHVWMHACEALVKRHPMLRTVFATRGGEPIQWVREPGLLDWLERDARGWDAERLERELAAAHGTPFHLEAAPPVRFRWFHREPEAPVLLLTFHHIVMDGWSLEVMRRELAQLVEQMERGGPELPTSRYTYQDFVWWQREQLSGLEGERLWAYWRERLAPPLPVLNLPTDHPRPAVRTYSGASVSAILPETPTRALRELAAREEVTLYALWLTVFAAVLSRWARQPELLIGTPTAGRTLPEFTPLVGYFVDPVVVRVAVDRNASFRSLLADVKQRALEAMDHRDFPFPLLVERLQLDRDPSRSPLFDVSFNFHSRRAAAQGRNENSHAQMEDLELAQAAGKFDLTLTVVEDEQTLSLELGYNSDLFDAGTVERLLGWIQAAAEDACHNPKKPVGTLALEPGGGFHPVLCGRPIDPAAHLPIQEQFLRQAERNPLAIALVAPDGTLTYEELKLRSQALASRLRALGVSPEVPVALLTGRTSGFVVGMLAVLLAGGAFLPLDPAHPRSLLETTLERAGARVILLGSGLADADWGIPALEIEAASQVNEAGPGTLPQVVPEQLAYVLFTSGSTGVPKGVAVEHRSLSNYVASIIEDLEIPPGQRFGLVSTVAADLGHTVIFPALATGGTLHLLPDAAATNPSAFSAYLASHELDYLKIVPSHLAALIGDPSRDTLSLPRKAVILGGESTPTAWLRRLANRAACRFFNHYGPTETTVGVLTYPFLPEQPPASSTLPLGKAVANARIYLLDEHGETVPPGVPGEVYIGGTPVARGYVGDEARTRERFVTLADGVRAYRTGDLARQQPDGTLLLLGREDRQVNLHGYRVELGQVEAALGQHPEVRQCVVLPDADGEAATCLAAWVVPRGKPGENGLEASLREHLAARLPRHMVPAQLLVREELLFTANGKVDVAALRAGLNGSRPLPTPEARVAPRDEVEARLCRIWAEVLGKPDIGARDDFFQAGGHSLLAVRLAGRVAESFGYDLPIAAFFTHPTVERLATLIRAGASSASVLAPIETRGAGSPLFCLPGAGGNILYFSELVRHLGAERPVWGLQALGLTEGEPPQSIEEIAAQYVSLIRREVQGKGPYHLVGHSFGGLVVYEMARQLRAVGEAVRLLAILDNPAPSGVDAALERGEAAWLHHIAIRIGKLYGVDLRLQPDDLEGPDRNQRLIQRLRREGILSAEVTDSYFNRYVEVYKANAIAAARYAPPVAPLDVKIHLIRAADQDFDLGRVAVEAPAQGWELYSALPVDVIDAPGTHITMLTGANAAALAARLREILG